MLCKSLVFIGAWLQSVAGGSSHGPASFLFHFIYFYFFSLLSSASLVVLDARISDGSGSGPLFFFSPLYLVGWSLPLGLSERDIC